MSAAATCSECALALPPKKSGTPGPAAVVCSKPCQKKRSQRVARAKYAAQIKAAGGVPTRKCKRCQNAKPLLVGDWYFSHGAPLGALCLPCFHDRHMREYRPRMRDKPHVAGIKQKVRVVVRAAKALRARQSTLGPGADAPLRLGADALTKAAKRVMKEVAAAVDDPDSPFHRDALELMATRLLPQKAVNEAALRMLREGEFGGDAGEESPGEPAEKKTPRGQRRYVVNVQLVRGSEPIEQ